MDIYIGFKNADGGPSEALESQKVLLNSTEKHVLAAGSLGWGKTDWLMIQAMIEAVSFKNNIILLKQCIKYILYIIHLFIITIHPRINK